MSIDAAYKLVKRAELDEDFRRRLLALPSAEEKKAFVHECGYDVGPEDFEALWEAAGLQELSEEDLDQVAGGGTSTIELAGALGGGMGVTAGAAIAGVFLVFA